MKVGWSPDAEHDRHDIWEYIAADNPRAAARIDALFDDAACMLADFPLSGHFGRASGTRELIPHESYRLVYELDDDTVWILALVHTAPMAPETEINFHCGKPAFDSYSPRLAQSRAIRPAFVSTAKGGGLMSNCFGERVSPREFTNDSIIFGVRV